MKQPIFSFDPTTELAAHLSASKLVDETIDISEKFKFALYEILQSLEASQITPKQIARYLFFHLPQHYDKSLLKGANDYDVLNEYFSEGISWVNFELINELIKEFLHDQPEIHTTWETYKSELKEYANKRIVKYDRILFGPPSASEHPKLVLALDQECDMKLNDVFKLRHSLCKLLDLPSLFFATIQCSSIILVFIAPPQSRVMLIAIVQSRQKLSQLVEWGIISLHFEEQCVFPDLELEWSDVPGYILGEI